MAIDGVDVGPFILDTGASGLVISGAAAERLNLRKFGEVWVSGVAGKVPCNFRRGDTLELGPITIDAPVFMEMSVGGIVSGSSEPVAGIVGFDVFKSAILEVGPGGSPVRLYDPQKFIPPVTWDWKPLLMVSNVPHVAASFAGAPLGKPQIFMIDSGAGGADCIFHARAVREMNLEKLLPGTKRASSRVRGVGSYDTEYVLIDSTEPKEYTIEIPSQGANTFSSFVMYIVERDQPVYITNVVVSSGASAGSGSEPGTDGGKVADFSNGAFEGATVETENEIYTLTGQDWAGRANNAAIYPISFEEGGTNKITASAATQTNVRFRFET